MAEYINREAVNRISFTDAVLIDGEVRIEKIVLVRDIKKLPAADVAPVRHGQWDGEGDGYADGEIVLDVWYCSACGHCIDDGTDDPYILPNYCPNCGAKMEEVSE